MCLLEVYTTVSVEVCTQLFGRWCVLIRSGSVVVYTS